MSGQHGVTLIELLVVLALLGSMAGVVGLSLRSAHPVPMMDVPSLAVARARDSAVRLGRAVTVEIACDSQIFNATALPDGRVVVAKRLGIDQLTGAPNATP